MTDLNLPELTAYSPGQIARAAGALPSVARYSELLRKEAKTPQDLFRQKRHTAWLRAVLAIFFDTHTPGQVCHFWSRRTDELLREAWTACGLDREPLSLFALGKLGCDELNLSSDVDLMILSQSGREFSSRSIQTFQRYLSELTEFGFAFRTDFDLRAGGRLSPLVSTYQQFEDFYGNYGDTLDRMALIRLKALYGPPDALEDLRKFVRKFTFRRFTDYTLLHDFQDLRPKIHASHQQTRDRFNLKLHPGGIRDIELFTHAWQIIHGGKHASLQTPRTDLALKELGALKLIPEADAESLARSYWLLRDLENRLQAENDHQTHTVRLDADNPFLFQKTSAAELAEIRKQVDRLVSTLLGKSDSKKFSLPQEPAKQSQWLAEKGFSQATAEEIWPRLLEKKIRSKQAQRDENERQIFLQKFIEELVRVDLDKDLALHLLTDFLQATRAKASFFKLFNLEPALIKDFAFLLSTSPYLGGLISSRPELIDSFLLRRHEEFHTDFEVFLEQLVERRQLTELIVANDFLSQRNISVLLTTLSQSADDLCRALLDRLKSSMGLETSALTILTMGKWAGREIGLRSDLDFVLVSKETISPEDHKLARKFLSCLSAPQKGGSLYSIDLRLRPSGKSGPLIVSMKELETFLGARAEAWERQAYLKSRFLEPDLDVLPQVLARKLSPEELLALKDIRRRLLEENRPSHPSQISLKYHPGGLVDIEFAAQIACLSDGRKPKDVSTVSLIEHNAEDDSEWKDASGELLNHYHFIREIEQLYQLCTSQSGSVIDFSSPAFERVCRLRRQPVKELQAELLLALYASRRTLERLDPALSAG